MHLTGGESLEAPMGMRAFSSQSRLSFKLFLLFVVASPVLQGCSALATRWQRLNGDVTWASTECTVGAATDDAILVMHTVNHLGVAWSGVPVELSNGADHQHLVSNRDGWIWRRVQPGDLRIEISDEWLKPLRESLQLQPGSLCQIRIRVAPRFREIPVCCG
jgi:hypothetical protein